MADDTLTLPPPPVETEDDAPKRRRRRLLASDETRTEATDRVLDTVRNAQDERQTWMDLRTTRYAKFRGWLDEKDYPWEECSNHHIAVMMADALRMAAGLYNAVVGIRPVMSPKTLRRDQKEKAEAANGLIDYQLFVENDGETTAKRYIDQFVQDGTVFSFQPWARDRRKLCDVRVQPKPEGEDFIAEMGTIIPALYPSLSGLVVEDKEGYRWSAVRTTDDGDTFPVDIRVYDKDDDKIEIVTEWEDVLFDGPTWLVPDLEDIVVPMRCENPQPISPQNPRGAKFVARLFRIDADTIRKRQADGTYDYLSAEDLKKLDAHFGAPVPTDPQSDDQIRQAKDRQAGLAEQGAIEHNREWLTGIEWYGTWDTDGDGIEEDVIFTVLREPQMLVRARTLTEQYPGMPVRRPFSHTCLIYVAGHIYGIGLLELMEAYHDLLHTIVNQMVDSGALTNMPFGMYRASSGIKAEKIRVEPGVLWPSDTPQQDLFIPSWPQMNQEWSLNMVGLITQMLADLTQIGPLQKGQVPQGKASALRTMGTTMAILQQGAAMPEQSLRHLFHGLRQVWEQFHLLNIRFLPKRKQFLIAGKSLDQDDAYGMIADPMDIAVPVAFDFQATLLNTNKGLVTQALTGIGPALINPLTLQTGIITPEEVYNYLKDLVQAAQLDPARYLRRPLSAPMGERHTAQEAAAIIAEGRLPEYAPLEPPDVHVQALMAIKQDPAQWQMYLLHGTAALFDEYLMKAMQGAQQAMQAQALMQAAEAFGKGLGNEGQGQGAQATELPPMQTEAPQQSEIEGANSRA